MSALVLPTFGAVALTQCRRINSQLGDFDRALSGRARSDEDGVVRAWQIATGEYEHAQAYAIEAELLAAPSLGVTLFGMPETVCPRDVQVGYVGVSHAVVTCTLHAQDKL